MHRDETRNSSLGSSDLMSLRLRQINTIAPLGAIDVDAPSLIAIPTPGEHCLSACFSTRRGAAT